MISGFAGGQQFVDLGHDFESIGDVEHVGLAARPAADKPKKGLTG